MEMLLKGWTRKKRAALKSTVVLVATVFLLLAVVLTQLLRSPVSL